MIHQIGNTAGNLWLLLKNRGEISVSQLPKMMEEKSIVVHQALGWLAREGKINYRTEGNKTLVSLMESDSGQ